MIYFDNSATTPLCDLAKERILRSFERFGNPSSMHYMGLEAEKDKGESTNAIKAALNIPKEKYRDWHVIFTSGGTEANNLAIQGCARAKKWHFKPQIIISDSEHPCITETAASLENEGFEVVRLRTIGGMIDEQQLFDVLCERTVLLSIMSVNNETGAVYDVEKLFKKAKLLYPSLLCHTDAIQAFFKIDFSPIKCKADLVSISSHKIHGPKGTGALIVNEKVLKEHRLSPILFGGGQEGGLRSGTENTPGICGFGGAAEAGIASFPEDQTKMRALRDRLIDTLPGGYRVTDPPLSAPHIVSIVSPGIKSETLLHFLSAKGICVSSGSACSSHGGHGSYVLKGYGLSDRDADCTIRISFAPENTFEEIAVFTAALEEADRTLVKIQK